MSADHDSAATGVSRRRFVLRVLALIGGAIAAVLAAPVVGFATAPGWRSRTPIRFIETSVVPTLRSDEWTSVGLLADFVVGEPVFVEVERDVTDGWVTGAALVGAYVVRQSDTDVEVFDPHCTHLGCPLAWSSGAGTFVCPCHGGVFSTTGEVVSGPPPHALIRYDTRVEEGKILIGALQEGL